MVKWREVILWHSVRMLVNICLIKAACCIWFAMEHWKAILTKRPYRSQGIFILRQLAVYWSHGIFSSHHIIFIDSSQYKRIWSFYFKQIDFGNNFHYVMVTILVRNERLGFMSRSCKFALILTSPELKLGSS